MANVSRPVEKLTYEQAYAELEEIINRMESETLALEDALSLFERGQALVKHCSELLEKAELKVRQVGEGESSPEAAA